MPASQSQLFPVSSPIVVPVMASLSLLYWRRLYWGCLILATIIHPAYLQKAKVCSGGKVVHSCGTFTGAVP